jgi:hypothetical protein
VAADERIHRRHAAFFDAVVEAVGQRVRRVGRLGVFERRAQAIEVVVQRVAAPPGRVDAAATRPG